MSQLIYIVRHGNTFDRGDVVTRVGARTDLDLSVSGRAQAQALATHFSATTFARIYSSPLKRTMQTAEAIADKQPDAPKIDRLEFLREIDYGPDENVAEDQVVERLGRATLLAWEEAATVPPGWHVDPEKIKAAWADFFSAQFRIGSDGPILVVTSNGIARFALRALDTSRLDSVELKLKTGAYGVVELVESGGVLKAWNRRP